MIWRDTGQLIVLQAWFDDSGKGQEPVYVLAGYVGPKSMWEDFADDWQAELDREPKLPHLHVKESQLFKGYKPAERTARLLRFVEIIKKHKPQGITYILKHAEYREVYRILSQHPLVTRSDRNALKNPYCHSFSVILVLMLKAQGEKLRTSGIREQVEVLFDDDKNERARLKAAFAHFVWAVRRNNPEYLDLLINKDAEFRDDKLFLPLQACDLLAWHLRRLCHELLRGKLDYQYDPVWQSLREATTYQDYRHSEEQWVKLLLHMRADLWADLN